MNRGAVPFGPPGTAADAKPAISSRVDIVVVTYASERSIGDCLDALRDAGDVRVTVVDNASPDRTADVVRARGVPVRRQARNIGFAAASNVGAREGQSPYILFLNPDAVLDDRALLQMVALLDADPSVGIAAPKFLYPDGRRAHYLRRFPTVASAFAQALFVDRVFPGCSELVTDELSYAEPQDPDWVPGACLLVRRTLFEQLGGFDERFFMYCEDKDLCRRTWEAGFSVRYEPEAICIHEGSGSAPRAALLPILAESRLLYAEKHLGRRGRVFYRCALILESGIRALLSRGGRNVRAGHLRSLAHVVFAADARRAIPR